MTIYGADQSLADVARTAMQGSYLGIIPRDSFFFVPKGEIRSKILSAHQDMAAVSIFRNGFTGLSIKLDYRVPVARWCGAAPKLAASSTSSDASNGCYLFDANGYVYGLSDPDAAPLNAALLYEPISSESIIGSTLPSADVLPPIFDFARQFASFGSPAASIAIRSDEVDVYVKSGTRITYVLGEEQEAFAALVSARANLNLADGSIEYVDLRFPGKVYLKKRNAP